MRRKSLLVLGVTALVAGSSLLVAGPVSAGPGPTIVDVSIEKVMATPDDPGVAFPIVLTCTSNTITMEPAPGGVSAAADIELGQNDTDEFTVELKNGESATISVQLPQAQPDLVTCEVTEDVDAAQLPALWVCDDSPDISPDEFTLFDIADEPEFDIPERIDVTVKNVCTGSDPLPTTTTAPPPVEVAPTFTG